MRRILACLLAILLLVLPIATAESGTIYAQKGDRGDATKDVQTRLIQLGYLKGSADGIFGNMTEAAVKAFQTASELEESGIVDDATYAALKLLTSKTSITTLETFVTRYNDALAAFGLSTVIAADDITAGEEQDVKQVEAGDFVYLSFLLEANTENIISVVFNAAGDGTEDSGVEIVLAMAAMLYACGGISELEEANDAFEAMGVLDETQFVSGGTGSMTVDGVMYTWELSELIGLLLYTELV